MRLVYLDSPAIVKLVVREAESEALLVYLDSGLQPVSCSLARTEVLRAVRNSGTGVLERARDVLRRIDMIRLDDVLLDAAGLLDPQLLRSLDAIHLAAAGLVSPSLEAIVTYDERMRSAAERLGYRVEAPA